MVMAMPLACSLLMLDGCRRSVLPARCLQVLTEVYGQRPLPLPEHVGVSLVLHSIVDQRQEVGCRWAS